MAEDLAKLETRPAEPKRNEKQDLAPTRKDDDQPQLKIVESKGPEEREVARFPAPLPRWPLVLVGLVVAIFAASVLYIIFRPRPDVWTDDAYVMVHYATIAPRVSGQVAMVPVDDNEVVRIGQVLATLDPRDNETALASAKAAVARDRSLLDEISANVSRQPSIIEEQHKPPLRRRAQGSISRRTMPAATVTSPPPEPAQCRNTSKPTARFSRVKPRWIALRLRSLRQAGDVLNAQRSASEAAVRADEAQLEQAKLNLSYTQVRAPIDGMVGERSVQVGNYVSPGTTLMTVVPLDQVYIEANYREVALLHVHSGQPVTIHLDAYNIDLKGTVDSVPPASGATFAPIAPNNATGNFTKIGQRLPVKIVVTPGQPLVKLLRVGSSVETTIHTGLENVVDEQRRSSERLIGH
jgi:membrane fusion protein (multidrug efflux system)